MSKRYSGSIVPAVGGIYRGSWNRFHCDYHKGLWAWGWNEPIRGECYGKEWGNVERNSGVLLSGNDVNGLHLKMDCLDFTTKNKNFFTPSPTKSLQSHQKNKQIHRFHWKNLISCESILTNVERMFGQHCPCGRQRLPWKLKPIPLRLPQRATGMGLEWANTGRMLWQRMGQRGKKFWRITIRKRR